jgi:hypothetical protein
METFHHSIRRCSAFDRIRLDHLVQIRMVSLIIHYCKPAQCNGKRKKHWRFCMDCIDLVISRGLSIRFFRKTQYFISLITQAYIFNRYADRKCTYLFQKIFVGCALLINIHLEAQDSIAGSLTISGYAEVYYQYDFNKPTDNNRPAFIYSHNRHNEFNLNLGFIKANYTAQRVRANLALASGTYVNANYAAEPGMLKNIFEANTGLKLNKKKSLAGGGGIRLKYRI